MFRKSLALALMLLGPLALWLTYLRLFNELGQYPDFRRVLILGLAALISAGGGLIFFWPYKGWSRLREEMAYAVVGSSLALTISLAFLLAVIPR